RAEHVGARLQRLPARRRELFWASGRIRGEWRQRYALERRERHAERLGDALAGENRLALGLRRRRFGAHERGASDRHLPPGNRAGALPLFEQADDSLL